MSGMLLTATLFISSGASDGKINIVDSTVSFTLVLCSLITMFGHFFIAHAFNRESMAEWAGGLHSVFSNAYCTVCFQCFGTYTILYVDSCLLKVPSTDMCTLFFRNSPFADIVVGVFSGFIMILFFASLALSFVSSPQDTQSYAFISKGTLLMSATLFGWVAPVAKSHFGRYGCPFVSPTLLGFDPLWVFIIFMGSSASMGVANFVTEWAAGGIYHPNSRWKTMVPHMVFDILTVVVSCMISLPLLFGARDDIGSAGMGLCLGISGVVSIWCLVDFIMALIFVSGCWKPWAVDVVVPSVNLIEVQGIPHQKRPLTPPGRAPEYNPNRGTLTRPPPTKMYMESYGDSLNISTMKKADSVPPSLRQTLDDDDAGGSMANVFVQEDVRRSLLRQRVSGNT